MAEDKKYIQGLNEYIRQGEPQEQERGLSRSLDNDIYPNFSFIPTFQSSCCA